MSSDSDCADTDYRISTESLYELDGLSYETKTSFNQLLPYADKLDEEAKKLIACIKLNLGTSTMMRNIKPGCLFWSDKLAKYIRLYGLRFTKADHVVLVKLIYELMTIPGLEANCVCQFGSVLIQLLKNEMLLSPTELRLPWEPMHQLCIRAFTDKYKLEKRHTLMEITLNHLSPIISSYYPPTATREILDELMPKWCPLDAINGEKIFRVMACLLPVKLHPRDHSIGYELWFKEFMKIWETNHNISKWQYEMKNLIVQLAWNNIGYIDWDPYIPTILAKFFHMLNLPCYYKKINIKYNYILRIDLISQWIVSVLGNKSFTQVYLEKFLKSVQSYFSADMDDFPEEPNLIPNMFYHLCFFFVKRLHRERYAEPGWLTPIPDHHKLSDDSVDAFVDAMLPMARIALYNQNCGYKIFDAIKYLAMLRPHKVISNITQEFLDREDLPNDPLKSITFMGCMMAMSQPIVQGSNHSSKEHAFVEGPSQVLSILFSCLDFIDSDNMASQCQMALKTILIFLHQVTVIDCSQSQAKKTEQERLVCQQTSRFRDFVLRLMEKVFGLINSKIAWDHYNEDFSDSAINSTVSNLFRVLLLQMSDEIFDLALLKLCSFVSDITIDRKHTAERLTSLCTPFAETKPYQTLLLLVPYLSHEILDTIGEDDVEILKPCSATCASCENVGIDLGYYVRLLISICSTRGDALLPYIGLLVKVLDKVLKIQSFECPEMSSQLLRHVLDSFCSVRPIRFENNLNDPNRPHWREWGQSIDIAAAKIEWYVPGSEEFRATDMLFNRYFVPAIALVARDVSKNELSYGGILLRHLRVIMSFMVGCTLVFPHWSESPVVNYRYLHCAMHFPLNLGNNFTLELPNKCNVRTYIVGLMESLRHRVDWLEHDNEIWLLIIKIYEAMSTSESQSVFKRRRKYFNMYKLYVENEVTGDQGYLPTVLFEGSAIKQLQRLALQSLYHFSITSVTLLKSLITSCVTPYSIVHSRARKVTVDFLHIHPEAHEIAIDEIVIVLNRGMKGSIDSYEGAVALLNKLGPILTKRGDWYTLRRVLPAFLKVEKPEDAVIFKLRQVFVDRLPEIFSTMHMKLRVPDQCVKTAAQLWDYGVPLGCDKPIKVYIEHGFTILWARGEINARGLLDTVNRLTRLVKLENNRDWINNPFVLRFIILFINHEQAMPAKVFWYLLDCLTHNHPVDRALAWQALSLAMIPLKREHVKVQKKILTSEPNVWKPGPRADNAWLQYSRKKVPKTAEEWDEPHYLHKSYVGYYAWPKVLKIYAPSSQQPELDKNARQFRAQEQELDHVFNNKERLAKMIALNTLGEYDDDDNTGTYRIAVFKILFSNHGDAYLDNILRHLRVMAGDERKNTQLFASQIICGIIRGAKHWNFEMTKKLWSNLLPIIRSALNRLTENSAGHWIKCLSDVFNNRDPHKLYWLLEFLMEQSKSTESELTFREVTKLLILANIISAQTWRLSGVVNRLLKIVETRLLNGPTIQPHLRNQLGTVLAKIFNVNMKVDNEQANKIYPEIEDFVNRIYPHVQPLLNAENRESEEYAKALRIFQPICSWIEISLKTCHFGAIPSFYKFYPVMSLLENHQENKTDEYSVTLSCLARTFILPKHIPFALSTLEDCSKSYCWFVRASVMKFLRVVLFHNMATLITREAWIAKIRVMTLQLIKDNNLEVREAAAELLIFMLQTSLIENHDKLLKEFKAFAQIKLRSRRADSAAPNPDAIILRHAGVLGLCAFIQAHPYDIPEFVPPILDQLKDHLSDQEPVPTTICKALKTFKDTHCETAMGYWPECLTQEHYEMFDNLPETP